MEKHKDEADSMKYQEPEWNCYELDVKNLFGTFNIDSKHTKDENTYNIWPEQMVVYVSKFNKETQAFDEPIKFTRVRSDVEYNAFKGSIWGLNKPLFTLNQNYTKNPDGRTYNSYINFDQTYDSESATYSNDDKYRIYVFQGHSEPIPDNLIPGEYKIPLSIRYAGRPGMYSMASGAVEDYGKLIVDQNGKLKLRFTFKPMTLSDPKYTGTVGAVEGHLLKLWACKSIDDFNDYMTNENFYAGSRISLDTPEYLKSKYTSGTFSFPQTYEVPLEYSNGKVNYESQKMFQVQVDAMGDNMPFLNMLLRHEEMVFEKANFQNGKYMALPLAGEDSPLYIGNVIDTLWDNDKFKLSEDEFKAKVADPDTDNSNLFDASEGLNPYYEVEFKDNKANLTVSFLDNIGDPNGIKYEYGIVKINKDKDIRYKAADNNLYPIEILEEKDFTIEQAKTYGKKITKFKIKNVPLARLGDVNQIIQLENAKRVTCMEAEGESEIETSPASYDDPIENMYGINNFDLKKMVLVEGTTPDLNKTALQEKINEAKATTQGKKTDEAFDTLKAAITSAEEVLNSASEQTAIDGSVTTLNKAIEAFKSSPDKEAQLNKTDLDAKIKDADKISQGKKSEDAFKTLKAAIDAAKNVLNSANTQEQINEALANLNSAIDAFNKSSDVNVTPGASEKVYTLPVKLMHSVQDKESMGNKALVSPAKVSIKGYDVNIDLTFQGIEVPLGATKFYGHLTNLFSFEDNTIKGEAIPAEVLEQVEDKAMDGSQKQFPKVFRIKLTKAEFDNLKDNTLYVKVWVDAMDGLMGGTPGAGAQNARLVFDKSKMTEVTPGGETPTPTPTPTPNVPSREDVVDALKRYANLGGPQYTYQSNMMYVNAYNSLMSLLTKPNATDMQVKFAIDNLKAAAAGLTLDTSKPNNSGNNQGWGNNNQGWGNNNQGWGNNNQGWGNNNSGWGNNNQGWGNNNQGWGNNNQGWGNNNKNNQNNGPVTVQYEVPVEVLHAHQSGYSMANAAINHTARVEERDGKFRYSVNFHAIQRDFGGKTLTGNLTNLFIIDGSKYRADQSGNTWSWTMNGKYDRVNVAVWVDAMDEIAGKGPGGGEQNAILSFNWNNAREVGRVGGNNNNQNQQNQNQQNQQKQQNQNQQAVQNNNTNNFTDTSGHWAKTAIDYVVSKGYFAGLSNTEFGPNKSITRGQFVSVLGRMLNVNVNDYKDQNFKDVKSGMYYSPYITWANKVGIASGVGQGNFAPDKELTREEMAVMMTKFLKVSGKNLNAKGKTNAFKDEDKIQGWAKDSVKEMARLGIVSGMGDGNFDPKSSFTRAQVAQVLYNIDHN
ncbi:S-layer homology domain-containing protein [Peptoniphilus grossensis]|uniref:S-layer homology domain-containing protein n=1 Tax=Peptoniphilus grossensis TaxID=1465756 RepID=UPI001C4F8785|nr:S-layer homology domain-containing protein [Peptoniphilus grossensis]